MGQVIPSGNRLGESLSVRQARLPQVQLGTAVPMKRRRQLYGQRTTPDRPLQMRLRRRADRQSRTCRTPLWGLAFRVIRQGLCPGFSCAASWPARPRRGPGELEASVLATLGGAPGPVTADWVREQIDPFARLHHGGDHADKAARQAGRGAPPRRALLCLECRLRRSGAGGPAHAPGPRQGERPGRCAQPIRRRTASRRRTVAAAGARHHQRGHRQLMGPALGGPHAELVEVDNAVTAGGRQAQ